MPASRALDEFDFTRIDLLQPQTSVHIPDAPSRWSLVVCRGCAYDCAICGGSAYTYKKYLGMDKPAFRSPARLVADIQRLVEQGVRFIGLYQDPRVGGKRYWQELFALLKAEKPAFERLSLDLLVPAGQDFIAEIAQVSRNIILHLCPTPFRRRPRSTGTALLHRRRARDGASVPQAPHPGDQFFSVASRRIRARDDRDLEALGRTRRPEP